MLKKKKSGKYYASSASPSMMKKIAAKKKQAAENDTGGGGNSANAQELRRGKLASPLEQQDYPPEEYKALRDYTDSSHVNYELSQNEYDDLSPYYKNMVDNLDSAIAKSGWNDDAINTPLERGAGAIVVGVPVTKDFSSPYDLADYINKNRIGTENINVGYTSITGTHSVAMGFKSGEKNGIIIKYDKIGKGMRGAYVSGGKGKTAISVYHEYENETLLQRNVNTIPTKAYVKNGTVYVHVIAKP